MYTAIDHHGSTAAKTPATIPHADTRRKLLKTKDLGLPPAASLRPAACSSTKFSPPRKSPAASASSGKISRFTWPRHTAGEARRSRPQAPRRKNPPRTTTTGPTAAQATIRPAPLRALRPRARRRRPRPRASARQPRLERDGVFALAQACEQPRDDPLGGLSVAVRVGGPGHSVVRGPIAQQPRCRFDDLFAIVADEPQRTGLHALGAFGFFTHDEHGLADAGRLFLNAAAVGQDERAIPYGAD